MAWVTQGKCKFCAAQVGPLEDYAASIYFCESCKEYRTIEYIPRRFELPCCSTCEVQFQKSGLVKRALTPCPSCDSMGVEWEITMHLNMAFVPESLPALGDLVQGFVTNTGRIQRIEFVHSNMRGRLGPEEPDIADGTAVEARVVGLGERSLDVTLVRELSHIEPLERENKAVD